MRSCYTGLTVHLELTLAVSAKNQNKRVIVFDFTLQYVLHAMAICMITPRYSGTLNHGHPQYNWQF